MICPNCYYEYRLTEYENIGLHGDFFTISNDIKMTRFNDAFLYTETAYIHGCPSCGIIFIDP